MATGMKRLRFRAGDVKSVSKGLAADLSPQDGEAPQQTASRYLELLFGAPEVPTMALSADEPASAPELTYEETLEQPLTETTQVSYTQRYHDVPVHGARLGVELSRDRQLVGIDGQVADVQGVSTIPRLTPEEARERLEALPGFTPGAVGLTAPSGPVVRWDEAGSRWALAYVFESVLLREPGGTEAPPASGPGRLAAGERRYRVFIDAHSGEEIVRVPLARHVTGTGADSAGGAKGIEVSKHPDGRYALEDARRKIRTCSLSFQSYDALPTPLPGEVVTSDSPEFKHPAAVAAHAHAATVYDFFQEVLKRKGIGGPDTWIHCAVECVSTDAPDPDWRNAMWLRVQDPQYPTAVNDGMMIYGQVRTPDGSLRSVAEGLEVVAHELTHGVTGCTAGLEYVTESGALDESYSDIFGVLVANHGKPVAQWNWTVGAVLSDSQEPLRDLQHPEKYQQPAHMSGFKKLKPREKPNAWNDHGYVHDNSGIHNKAAYHLLSSGKLSPREAAQLFYLTLTTPGRLSATATFADSREGLIASCETLFRTLGEEEVQARAEAVSEAFKAVGL